MTATDAATQGGYTRSGGGSGDYVATGGYAGFLLGVVGEGEICERRSARKDLGAERVQKTATQVSLATIEQVGKKGQGLVEGCFIVAFEMTL